MPAFKPRGSARKIKLSKNLKPFVSRVVRSGAVQIAFKEQIGKPVGGCVAGRVREGMSGYEVHTAAYECSRQAVGRKLSIVPVARRRRVPMGAPRAPGYAEYSEIA